MPPPPSYHSFVGVNLVRKLGNVNPKRNEWVSRDRRESSRKCETWYSQFYFEQRIQSVEIEIVPDISVRPDKLAVLSCPRNASQRTVQPDHAVVREQLHVRDVSIGVGRGDRIWRGRCSGPDSPVLPGDRCRGERRHIARVCVRRRLRGAGKDP